MKVFKDFTARRIGELRGDDLRKLIEEEMVLRDIKFTSTLKPAPVVAPQEPTRYAEEIGQVFRRINSPRTKGVSDKDDERKFLITLFDEIATNPSKYNEIYEDKMLTYFERKRAYDKLLGKYEADIAYFRTEGDVI